jgi:hypothetical protein
MSTATDAVFTPECYHEIRGNPEDEKLGFCQNDLMPARKAKESARMPVLELPKTEAYQKSRLHESDKKPFVATVAEFKAIFRRPTSPLCE